jgi:pimeloyl-ACP methyl ester carboxylesterase
VSQQWRRRRIPLGWGRLNVYIAGEGPPLLLLHGLGGSGRYWADLAPHLGHARTLIAPDLAGFGRSDKPATDYARAFHLDNLERLLAALRIDGSIGVAGHSMGGVLAALFAARHAERVEALALAAAPFPRVQLHPYRMPHGPGARLLYGVLQRTLPVISPLVRSNTFPRAVVADYLRHTPASYQMTSNSLIWDVSVVGELEALRGTDRFPQLLVYSAEDRTIAPDSLQRWQELLPRAHTRLVPGGHQLLLRGGFAVLADWWGEVTASRVA